MKLKKIFILLTICAFSLFAQETKIHHKLHVKIDPAKSFIEVTDDILIKKEFLNNDIVFSLNHNLNLKFEGKGINISLLAKSVKAEDLGMDRDDIDKESELKINKYIISEFDMNSDLNFTVKYSGK